MAARWRLFDRIRGFELKINLARFYVPELVIRRHQQIVSVIAGDALRREPRRVDKPFDIVHALISNDVFARAALARNREDIGHEFSGSELRCVWAGLYQLKDDGYFWDLFDVILKPTSSFA